MQTNANNIWEFINKIYNSDLIEELAGTGTKTKLSDWLIYKVSIITQIDLRLRELKDTIDDINEEIDEIIRADDRIIKLMDEGHRLSNEYQSLMKKYRYEFNDMCTIMNSKLDDLRERLDE